MVTHEYDKTLNGSTVNCARCGRRGQHHQHHIYLRRYSAICIWVCWKCHQEIHAHPAAAYRDGYLKRHNLLPMKKEQKTKSCKHPITYFDKRLGYNKCNFCGTRIEEIRFGVKKKPERDAKGGGTTKIGFEKQDPRIEQAEKLKRESTALQIRIKKEKDVAKRAELEVALGQVTSEMRDLKKTFED